MSSNSPSRQPRRMWRKHALALALIAGCTGNLAIRDYAQEKQRATALESLARQIALDNSQEIATTGYLKEARSARK